MIEVDPSMSKAQLQGKLNDILTNASRARVTREKLIENARKRIQSSNDYAYKLMQEKKISRWTDDIFLIDKIVGDL